MYNLCSEMQKNNPNYKTTTKAQMFETKSKHTMYSKKQVILKGAVLQKRGVLFENLQNDLGLGILFKQRRKH